MVVDRKFVVALVLAAAFGWWLGGRSDSPAPPADKPVLRWIARAAKSFLWIALVAEKPPQDDEPRHLVKSQPIGEDGFPLVDHSQGW